MREQIKKQWIAALRSGKYKQGKSALCRANQNGTRYCCLGVLSNLAVKDGALSRKRAFRGNSALNQSVMDWAGTESCSPVTSYGNCIAMNDEKGFSFEQIADALSMTEAYKL